jgi:hypothetical protein
MSASVFTGTIYHALKATLDSIVDDKTDGYESGMDLSKWMKVKGMSDNYEDDLEMGGPGLASMVNEGTEVPLGTIREGVLTRYQSFKYGLRLVVSEEAIEDSKYDRAINAAGRLKRALFKTADIDATFMLVRATSTSYPIGDGLPWASASHTLPAGGTFSNTMATPMSPSRMALIQATSSIKKYPGHDGITEGYLPKKVLYPTEQWAVWDGILKSDKAPEPGAFNEINVAKTLDLEGVPLKYWDNTTTAWCVLTDCEAGPNFRWRRRAKSRTWVENSQELMNYSISARWARGVSDPRSLHYVDI